MGSQASMLSHNGARVLRRQLHTARVSCAPWQLTCSWRFKEGVTADQISHLMEKTRTLREAIPGVTALSIGENVHELHKGQTHAMAITYADKDAMDGWDPHPAHQQVLVDVWSPIVDF